MRVARARAGAAWTDDEPRTTTPELARLQARLTALCSSHLAPGAVETVASLARPAVRLHHTGRSSRSHLGGAAMLDDPSQWPRWHGRPLSLLAVLDLADVAAFVTDALLPRQGRLNIFYDDLQQPWGFAPEDAGGWRVVAAGPDARPVPPPAGARGFVSIGLAPEQILTIPGWEEPAAAPLVPPHDDESPAAEAARDAYATVEDTWCELLRLGSGPHHQIGGWPLLQQGPIWQECDVVSRGLALGTAEEWQAAVAALDPASEADWHLLVQLDSDHEAGWAWGDAGALYVAVRRSLVAPRCFDEAWLVLQCG